MNESILQLIYFSYEVHLCLNYFYSKTWDAFDQFNMKTTQLKSLLRSSFRRQMLAKMQFLNFKFLVMVYISDFSLRNNKLQKQRKLCLMKNYDTSLYTTIETPDVNVHFITIKLSHLFQFITIQLIFTSLMDNMAWLCWYNQLRG